MAKTSPEKKLKIGAVALRKELGGQDFDIEVLDSDWREASIDAVTEDIAHLMARCAKDLGIEPADLTWHDFKEYTGYAFGQSSEKGVVPKHITRVGGFARIKDAYFPPNATSISIEKEAIRERATIHRSVSLAQSRDLLFIEQWKSIAEQVFKGKIQPSDYPVAKKSKNKTERYLNLLLSDLHFHSLLVQEEVPMPYGPHEEARRLAWVVLETARYKLDHRENTSLNVFLAGDIIQNQLHDLRDGAPLAEQSCAAMWYLVHAIRFLAQHFKQVNVYCTTGNHGRLTSRHANRATNQKWDSVETQIYYALKMACIPLANVTVTIPKLPYITYEVFGMKGFVTHGDTVVNPGYPGRSINVSSIETQVNRINASLPDAQEFRLYAVGHVHIGSSTKLPNGAVFLTNGALVPSDQYGVSIGMFETSCGQTLWESVPGHMVGDYRFIDVDGKIDKNADLEKIIPAFPGF